MNDDFETTRWGLVLAAREGDALRSREALGALCTAYWKPLYAYVRRQGHDVETARDLTQAYFATLLEKGYLRDANPRAGKFRTFLLVSLKHFLSKERDKANAQKRGGGRSFVSLDVEAVERMPPEPAGDRLAPDKLFEKRWAMTVLERALERLREQYAAAGHIEVFERLKGHLDAREPHLPHRKVAEELKTTEQAVRMATHRMRKRFRRALRDEVAQTVAVAEEVDTEIRQLQEALRG